MPTNPFRFGKIVYDKHFYNREEELRKIKSILSSGNNIALYAPRRYGKSSLVAKAFIELQLEGFICVHFDFMSVYSKKSFIENYSKEILKTQKKSEINKFLTRFSSLIKGIKPTVSIDQSGNPEFSLSFLENIDKEESLMDIINLPEALSEGGKKYIIAFDEFQEIATLNGENFEKLLRSQIQKHKNVSYIFLGSKTHLLKDMFSNKNRAFYNSAEIMSLDKIVVEKSIDFLSTKFAADSITIHKETAQYLLNKVDNIPYYIQFMAHQVWEHVIINDIQEVTKEVIDSSFDSILEIKDDYYWELTNKQSAHRKKLLYALSCNARGLFSDKTSKKYELGAASTTQKSLDVLINEGIIEKVKSQYEFSDPIYKKFISIQF